MRLAQSDLGIQMKLGLGLNKAHGPGFPSHYNGLALNAVRAVELQAEEAAVVGTMSIPRVTFADTGVEVSAICLGTMMFGDRTDEDESIRLMDRALEAGIDFWDTAPMYAKTECERIVGKALAGRRDRVFLATKVHKGVTYEDITSSCDESLQRLDTDHVDLGGQEHPITATGCACGRPMTSAPGSARSG